MLKKILRLTEQKEVGFEKMDLHIHTPASHRCYAGPKTEEEYIRIIEKAREKRLRVIAVTDHNTIIGFKKIMDIRDEVYRRREDNLAKENTADLKRQSDYDKKILDCFSGMLILPGIEFETEDNVHILIIFDPETPMDTMENFIISGGHAQNIGYESPPTSPNWNVRDVLDEAAKFDTIVIAAHIDSNKGLHNTFKPGTYRANCFRSENLDAVEYNNEKTKGELQYTVQTSLEYQRKLPLAFIKGSDAHAAEQVGRRFTWFRIQQDSEVTFETVKRAISNPSECIATEAPSVEKILNSLINEQNSFGISSLSQEDKENLKRLICALNNSEGGYCLIGLNKNKNRTGLDLPSELRAREERTAEYLKEVFSVLREIEGEISLGFQFYPLQDGKLIISLRVKNTGKLATIKNENKVYMIEKNEPLSISGKKIQNIIEERQLKTIETKIEATLEKTHNELNLLLNTVRSQPIIRVFEDKSILLRKVVTFPPSLKKGIKLNEKQIIEFNEKCELHPNGMCRGNIVFIVDANPPARLAYAYLRYSPPIIKIKAFEKPKRTEIIYAIFGGPVYYSNSEMPIYFKSDGLAISFSSDKPANYSNKFIAAFLKSSFYLWYAQNTNLNLDLVKLNYFEKARIPLIRQQDRRQVGLVKAIENNLDKILAAESEYLTIPVKKSQYKEIKKITDAHNQKIDLLAYDIDKKIYELLGLSEEQIRIIEAFLRAEKIYVPDKAKLLTHKEYAPIN